MAEIQRTRIKSIYGDIKGLLSQLPQPDTSPYVAAFLVNGFNSTVDELSHLADTDYSRYKVTHEAMVPQHSKGPHYYSIPVRTQIGRFIARLEEEYDLGKDRVSQSPTIAIFNKNQNEVSVQVNYTINDLIEKAEEEEGRIKLRELRDELEKSDKSWEKIKGILLWVLNFSKDLFLQILPIILQKKL